MKKIYYLIITTIYLLFSLFANTTFAASNNVIDNANLFSSSTIDNINSLDQNLYNKNKQEIVLYTTQSLNGQDINTAATNYAQQQSLNGVLIYIASSDKKFAIKVTTSSRPYFSTTEEQTVNKDLASSFSSGNYNSGITQSINIVYNDLLNFPSVNQANNPNNTTSFNWFWVIIIAFGILFIFSILRNIGRYGTGGASMMGPGYGGNGGGGFFSGFLGGLGGSIVGNAIFDNLNNNNNNSDQQNNNSGMDMPTIDPGVVDNSPSDTGGWDGGDSGSSSDPGTGSW